MEPYCLVLWLETDEVGVMARIPESVVAIAQRCGWHVLARESEIPYVEPALSQFDWRPLWTFWQIRNLMLCSCRLFKQPPNLFCACGLKTFR